MTKIRKNTLSWQHKQINNINKDIVTLGMCGFSAITGNTDTEVVSAVSTVKSLRTALTLIIISVGALTLTVIDALNSPNTVFLSTLVTLLPVLSAVLRTGTLCICAHIALYIVFRTNTMYTDPK